MTVAMLQSALFAAVAGFLTRPCCVIPAALSLAGVGSAGLSSIVVTHRPLFLATSALSLLLSTWLTFRRTGGTFNKALAVIGSLIVFFITAGYIGVLDVL